jgi:MYXO-CTERM domain-containing protein
MVSSRASFSLLGLAIASSLVLLAPDASAVTPAASPVAVFTLPAGACVRSPDITFTNGAYFVAWAQGPCANIGAHTVFVARLSPSTFNIVGSPSMVGMTASVGVDRAPLVRIASAAGRVLVVFADRSNATGGSTLRALSFDATDLTRAPIAQSNNSASPVLALSLDCHTSGGASPCAMGTIENTGLGRRAISRTVLNTPAQQEPQGMILPGEDAIAIASLAGDLAHATTLVVTNSVTAARPAVIASPPEAMGVRAVLTGGQATPLHQGAGVTRLRSGAVVGTWTAPSRMLVSLGPTWGMRTSLLDISIIDGPRGYVIDDAVTVGGTLFTVGRAPGLGAPLDGAPFGYAQLDPSVPPMSVAIDTIAVSISSPLRASAADECPSYGKAAVVFAQGGVLGVLPYSCSADSDCVDLAGTLGMCRATGTVRSCVFPLGSMCNPATPDASVPVDASASDGGSVDSGSPMDGGAAVDSGGAADSGSAMDGSGAVDSAIDGASVGDGASADAAVIDGAARDGSNSDLSIHGGSCACRATGATTAGARGAWALVALAAALAGRARRRRG